MNRQLRGNPGNCLRTLLAIGTAALLALAEMAEAENPGKKKASTTRPVGEPVAAKAADFNNPIVQLMSDPDVQSELQLTANQVQAFRLAYDRIEPRLWPLRDATQGPSAEEKAKLSSSLSVEVTSILDPAQGTRLAQLALRARGWPGLLSADVATQLKLSPDQLSRIGQITETTRQEIQKANGSSETAAAREGTVALLRTQEGKSIQALLSAPQQQKLAGLVGDHYDLSQVRPLTYQAPALQQVDEWINTEPLKLAELRGKVVAFHFWAFGCINCVHNLPHYAKWHDQYAAKGLVVLGMHTPETQAERNAATLRSKIEEHSIRYPVAADHDNQNWSAWANYLWPSVYLIDKRGRVRYWWYGELNWQETEGEQWMRQKIEHLLAEGN